MENTYTRKKPFLLAPWILLLSMIGLFLWFLYYIGSVLP